MKNKSPKELAEDYYAEQMERGELNSRHMDTLDQAFIAGYVVAEKRAQGLVEALESIAAIHLIGKQICEPDEAIHILVTDTEIARKAIAEYKESE